MWNLDEIPVERLIAPAVVVNISERASRQLDAELLMEELMEWERNYGEIPQGAVVLMYSGWAERWPDESAVFGTDMANDDLTLRGITSLFYH